VGTTALVITISYAVVVVIGVALAIGVWSSTRSRRPLDSRRLAERERAWLLVVVALLVGLLLATIWFTPYGQSASSAQVVNVVARQFVFQMTPVRIKAGHKVEFRLTSADVNHGFAIYDDRDRFVGQIQVVPGEAQTLVHTFERPGRYSILCFEFCGVGHHLMQASFEVTR
jgi:cytochrome c oxidase subunit II